MLEQYKTPGLMKSITVTDSAVVSLTDFGWSSRNVSFFEELIISVRNAPVIYSLSTTDPTPNFGHRIADNSTVIISGTNMVRRAKFIAESSDAVVIITPVIMKVERL
jgi:hypothetical protein